MAPVRSQGTPPLPPRSPAPSTSELTTEQEVLLFLRETDGISVCEKFTFIGQSREAPPPVAADDIKHFWNDLEQMRFWIYLQDDDFKERMSEGIFSFLKTKEKKSNEKSLV